MKQSILIGLLIAAVTLSGCSAALQQSSGTNTGTGSATTSGTPATKTRSLNNSKGYRPTAEDITKYSNDISKFLQANVPNSSKLSRALIVVDNEKRENLNGLSLSNVASISVMENAGSVILGAEAYEGAIVIHTK